MGGCWVLRRKGDIRADTELSFAAKSAKSREARKRMPRDPANRMARQANAAQHPRW